MVDCVAERIHPTGDEALSLLATVSGPIGDFVRAYPGIQNADGTDWLDNWFRARASLHLGGATPVDEVKLTTSPPLPVDRQQAARPIRLVSIHPHYFRGFREVPDPIPLAGDLVVIDGRNTSGKTSLAEALEWLFAGCLSRRESLDLGSAHELENCITNQFRPNNDKTWVAGTFLSLDSARGETFTLRRVLNEDYGATMTSKCMSSLYLDDTELTPQQERTTLDSLFASVPPILMQHTLHLFVQSDPKSRRVYFERLLHLDELTSLIVKAVIGDSRLSEFPSPTLSSALKTLETLTAILKVQQSQKACKKLLRSEHQDMRSIVSNTMIEVAKGEFPGSFHASDKLEEICGALAAEQGKSRQRSFPLLARLKPRKVVADDQYQLPYSIEELGLAIASVNEAWQRHNAAKEAAVLIGNAKVVVSKALKILLDNGVITRDSDPQTCPICEYGILPTLTSNRISEVEHWVPVQEAVSTTLQSLYSATSSVVNIIKKAVSEHGQLLPALPPPAEFEQSARLLGKVRYAQHDCDMS